MKATTTIRYGATRRTEADELHARILGDITERRLVWEAIHHKPDPISLHVGDTDTASGEWIYFDVTISCDHPTPEGWAMMIKRAVQVQSAAGSHRPAFHITDCEYTRPEPEPEPEPEPA